MLLSRMRNPKEAFLTQRHEAQIRHCNFPFKLNVDTFNEFPGKLGLEKHMHVIEQEERKGGGLTPDRSGRQLANCRWHGRHSILPLEHVLSDMRFEGVCHGSKAVRTGRRPRILAARPIKGNHNTTRPQSTAYRGGVTVPRSRTHT